MMEHLENVSKQLEQRGYTVRQFATGAEATAYLNTVIDGKTVGFGGSMTLKELGLQDSLGTHNEVFWHWVNGSDELPKAAQAEIYLASVNALAETGELINIDGVGNRVASTLYGHKKVYFVIGRNKIAATYEEAVWRARNIAAPLNARRLGKKTPCVSGNRCYDCKSPERICRAMVVLWEPMARMETEIILIDEDLGM